MSISTQESVNPGMRQRDAYGSAGESPYTSDYASPCRAFKLNTDSQLLWVKLEGDTAAVLGWYEKGLIYPLAAVNVLKDSSGPVALTAGDVTLID